MIVQIYSRQPLQIRHYVMQSTIWMYQLMLHMLALVLCTQVDILEQILKITRPVIV